MLSKFTDMVNTLNYLLSVKGNFHFRIYGQLNQFLSSIIILRRIVSTAGHTENRSFEFLKHIHVIYKHMFLRCLDILLLRTVLK